MLLFCKECYFDIDLIVPVLNLQLLALTPDYSGYLINMFLYKHVYDVVNVYF